MTLKYYDSVGNYNTKTATLANSQDYSNILILADSQGTKEYWDPDGDGSFEELGFLSWHPGEYDNMLLFTFDVAPDFNEGDITIEYNIACGGANIRWYSTSHISVSETESIDLTGEILIGQVDDNGQVNITYTGPEAVTLTAWVNGNQVPIIDGQIQLPAYGEHEITIEASAPGYYILTYTCCRIWSAPEKTADPQISLVQSSPNHYYIQATGNGEVCLYVNGVLVSNPYEITATDQDVTYVATATAQETGKLISNTVTCEFLIPKAYDTDNYFTMTDMTALHRDTIVVPVSLTNATSITAFQADIYLPPGFQVVKDEYGDYMVELSSRKGRDHIIMASDAADGAITVISYSSSLKNYKGNEGELFYITVKVPDNAKGDYNMMLKNAILTTSDYEELNAYDTNCTIHVLAYISGDVNDSGTITVTDVVTVARYILDQHPTPFIVEAADINGDGIITVTDLVLIARMVMTAGYNALLHTLPLTDDSLSANDLFIDAGQTRTMSIELNNESRYTALQLDLQLPDGLTASNFRLTGRASRHQLDTSILDDGSTTRVLCYSPVLGAIDGTEGALLTFDVTATVPVDGEIVVDGIETVTTGYQTAHLAPLTIGVNSTTASIETSAARAITSIDYYNIAGQHLSQPCKGVNIIVTTYSDGSRTTAKVNR